MQESESESNNDGGGGGETQTAVKSTDEASFIDLTKMACLLCKRRFESVDVLNKHVLKSDLHKVS